MLVHHLGDVVAQQHHVLIERLNLALQLDAVDQVNRHRDSLLAQQVEEGVLQQLGSVFVAHGELLEGYVLKDRETRISRHKQSTTNGSSVNTILANEKSRTSPACFSPQQLSWQFDINCCHLWQLRRLLLFFSLGREYLTSPSTEWANFEQKVLSAITPWANQPFQYLHENSIS